MTDKLKAALACRIPLKLREDGTFRVICASDFHAPDDRRWSPRLRAGVQTLVDVIEPDLFFNAGDFASHGSVGSDEKMHEYLADVMAPCEEKNIPWAHVPGNHDGRFEEGLKLSIFQSFPHCISERGLDELDGYGTYMIPVWPADGHTEDGPAFVIWAFDSHSGAYWYSADRGLTPPCTLPNMPVRFNGSDGVHFNQCAWYWDLSCEMEKIYGRKIPGIMFMHTPLQENLLVTTNPNECEMTGSTEEASAPGAVNTGLLAAVYERGDVRVVCAGHDHINSYFGKYMGIVLCEDGSLGYDVYGDDYTRGGHLFTFDANAEKPNEFSFRHVVVQDYQDCEKVGHPGIKFID